MGCGHAQEASRGTVLRPWLGALVSFGTSLTRQVVVLLIYLKAATKKITEQYHVSMWEE